MFGLRPWFAVSLGLTVLLGIGAVVGPRVDSAIRARNARQDLAAATASVSQLRVPAIFQRVQRNCQWYRCYYVPEPTGKVAPLLIAILNSTGAKRMYLDRLLRKYLPAQSDIHGFGLDGCWTVTTKSHGPLTNCAYAGEIHHHSVTVFLGPHFDVVNGHHTWGRGADVQIGFQ